MWLSTWLSIPLSRPLTYVSQADIDDEHEERSQYRDGNEEDEQHDGGNHEHKDVGYPLTQNPQAAVAVPPSMSENSPE